MELDKSEKISHCQAHYHAGNKADDKEVPLGNKGVDQTHVEGSLTTPITIPHGRLWDGNKVVYSNPKIDRKVGHLEIGIQCDPTPPGIFFLFLGDGCIACINGVQPLLLQSSYQVGLSS